MATEYTVGMYERCWERLVSDILSPPVVWAVMAFPLAFAGEDSRIAAISAAVIYGMLVCWLPVLYIAMMVKRGRITDIHMKVRSQRILPMMVSIGCSITAWVMLTIAKASAVLLTFSLFTIVALLVVGVVTLVWQISLHAMSITSAVVAAGMVFGTTTALVMLPLIPLVGAARLRLQRHTPLQLVAGGIVGALVPYLLFNL